MSWRISAAILGSTGVSLAAYGAHGLKSFGEKEKSNWKTANQYQMIHAVAIALLPAYKRTPARTVTGTFLTCGILFFSGSLYVSSLKPEMKLSGVAPLGGIMLVAGWISFAFLKR